MNESIAHPPDDPAGAPPARRKALEIFIKSAAAVIALVTLLPGVGYLLQPLLAGSQRRRRKVIFNNAADAQSSTFVQARYEGQEETAPGIFVRRAADGRVQALSAKCTHAGCPVQWQPDKNQFYCRCHQGYFDANGINKAGPPPRPLDRLATAVEGSDVYIEEPEA